MMSEDGHVSILIADHCDLVRLGLRAALEAMPGATVVGEAATARQAVAHAVRLAPTVALLEAALPEGGGVEACRAIGARAPGVRVLILGDNRDEGIVVAALRAGAAAFVADRAPVEDVTRAVSVVARGGSLLDATATRTVLEFLRHGGDGLRDRALTPLEQRVLGLVAEGRTNKEIAEALGITDKAVKAHLSRAFAKLNVSRRAGAAVLFASHRVVLSNPGGGNGSERSLVA
jgi:DNA-binding NarL/FixJ family response regulator